VHLDAPLGPQGSPVAASHRYKDYWSRSASQCFECCSGRRRRGYQLVPNWQVDWGSHGLPKASLLKRAASTTTNLQFRHRPQVSGLSSVAWQMPQRALSWGYPMDQDDFIPRQPHHRRHIWNAVCRQQSAECAEVFKSNEQPWVLARSHANYGRGYFHELLLGVTEREGTILN